MEKQVFTEGLIVKSHQTTRRHDKDPRFKVVMKSKNQKISLSVELPDLGRHIFHQYPLGEIVELSLKEPSTLTLDQFKEENEED